MLGLFVKPVVSRLGFSLISKLNNEGSHPKFWVSSSSYCTISEVSGAYTVTVILSPSILDLT